MRVRKQDYDTKTVPTAGKGMMLFMLATVLMLAPVLMLAAVLSLGRAVAVRAELGDGVVTDRLDEKAEAFRTWLPQALRGDSLAQFKLGAAFSTGRAEIEDFTEAARWFRKAARQGNPRAQNGLAILYSRGLGVRRDYVEAYVWWDLAAARFEHGLRHEQAIELRNMMAAFMTPEQVEEAKRMVEARQAEWE